MKKINLYEANGFGEKTFKNLLVHDSPLLQDFEFQLQTRPGAPGARP